MTSTIKVDNIQDQDGNNIINENANTITIGASGDTVTLASGASQSGFGRSGSVDWQTSIKTADFTAVSGEGYFVNTTSGAITVTLPSSPSAGAIVSIKDYANTADTNAITLARNGSNIDGAAEDVDMVTEGLSVTIVYADATKGWLVVESGQKDDLIAPAFVTATGGTITTVCTNFKVHTFTGPGTFTVTCAGNVSGSNTVDYLVIAGGGSGGSAGGHGGTIGGGGGAGGYRESSGAASGCYTASPLGSCVSALPVTAQGYPITVGAGGVTTFPGGPAGNNGSNSIFSTITSAGGGAGRDTCANSGGAGGGGGANIACGFAGGSGNTPPVSPPQGKNGGTGQPPKQGAGGGGAINAGSPGNPPSLVPGNTGRGGGGIGATSSINGSPTQRAGGGGGANTNVPDNGGAGGGGKSHPSASGGSGCNGAVNTGGGGGGGPHCGPTPANAGNGGSGIVIIRYKFQ